MSFAPKPPPLQMSPDAWEVPAFGRPGDDPTWARSSKDGVGVALGGTARCWFTFADGVITEVFYPRPDRPCLRDLRLLVSDGNSPAVDEELDCDHHVEQPHPGVPLYRLINTDKRKRFRLEKTLLGDPRRDALILRVRLVPLVGQLSDYHLYVAVNPHLGNRGGGNTGWVGDYKGRPMLFASREDPGGGDVALALASDTRWVARTAGYIGRSDGVTDLRQHGRLTWNFNHASDGNVGLTGDIDLSDSDGSFRLVLAFDRESFGAGLTAVLSLLDRSEVLEEEYVNQWQQWHREILPLDQSHPCKHDLFRTSAMVIRAHRSVHFPGGGVASLSTPWGQARDDEARNGYHVVWSRDLVQAAAGLLAAGAKEDARRVLEYLWAVQEPDGHWAQDMWMDGRSFATQVQLDETAAPILLVDLAHRHNAWDGERNATIERFWPMVRAAALFLCRNGPCSQEDRWEDTAGYTSYSLATSVAALAAAAAHAEVVGESALARCLRETADLWNDSIESWTYVVGTRLARQVGVEGYYVRLAPDGLAMGRDRGARLRSAQHHLAAEVVSPDALALVRFGLRRADDPRIINTVKAIDATLKADTPRGPCWRRYSFDCYGEHPDGTPFRQHDDKGGQGRPWPLLTGERGHFEVAAGRLGNGATLLEAMAHLAGDWGMIPEQVWDADPIPPQKLFPGRPSGSAMPLAWAHAEYLKLRRSLADGRCFDCPPEAERRYVHDQTKSAFALWQIEHQPSAITPGKKLRIELRSPARVRWGTHQHATELTATGMHRADLPTEQLSSGQQVRFAIAPLDAPASAGQADEFVVRIDPAAGVLRSEGSS